MKSLSICFTLFFIGCTTSNKIFNYNSSVEVLRNPINKNNLNVKLFTLRLKSSNKDSYEYNIQGLRALADLLECVKLTEVMITDVTAKANCTISIQKKENTNASYYY